MLESVHRDVWTKGGCAIDAITIEGVMDLSSVLRRRGQLQIVESALRN
jgi:hypothetical protein